MRLYGDPVLRKTATTITTFDDALIQLGEDLLETMYHYNGVGLAGPQVGLSKRIFAALHTDKSEASESEDSPPPETAQEKRERWGVVGEYVMVNPVITHRNGVAVDVEGCLSLPGLYYDEVERADSVTVTFQDVYGKEQQVDAQGHFARVIQHELDHLDGGLFTDRLPELERRSFMNTYRRELADMQREAKAFLKDLKARG